MTEMRRLVRLFFLMVLIPAATPAGPAEAGSSENWPTRETPRVVAELWLRYHASDLCQELGAEFAFNADKMEVRILVEDEDSYGRFREMVEPLPSHRIELIATHPPAKEDSDKDKNPPPSLWENYELRAYLGDPLARAREQTDWEEGPQSDPFADDQFFKYRLLAYAEQILGWNKKMERYAADLPALVHVVMDTSIARELRLTAAAIAGAHAKNLDKYVEKLDGNLKHALPESASETRRSSHPPKPAAAKAPVEAALNISAAAQTAARRIHHFIYPEQHSVDLDELRQSSLLESLKELRSMSADFQKAMGKMPRE